MKAAILHALSCIAACALLAGFMVLALVEVVFRGGKAVEMFGPEDES
jgi:hypothetical protein